MALKSNGIEQEKQTIAKMIKLYCKHRHRSKSELCTDCNELLEYAWKRLELCKHGENKPTCGKCPIHCYKPDMRKRVKIVMRYVGPKMVVYHPIEALRHLLKAIRS